MRSFFIILLLFLSGCYASTIIKQDYILESNDKWSIVKTALSENGFLNCGANDNVIDFCESNSSYLHFRIEKNTHDFSVKFFSHITHNKELKNNFKKVNDILSTIPGVIKACHIEKNEGGPIIFSNKAKKQNCGNS